MANLNLYYLHFNNYYNRIIKRFNTLSEYLVSPYYDGVVTENAAFNPNDSVETTMIINQADFDYDYMVAGTTTNIVSRWFVMEAIRKRNGQYELKLRRDMMSDSYDQVIDAPAFIEKATLSQGDPMIFNKEDMTFNQIKTSETLLKDETGCAWVVGYIPSDAFKNGESIPSSILLEGTADYEYSTLNDFPLKDILNIDYNGLPNALDYQTMIDIGSNTYITSFNATTGDTHCFPSGGASNGYYITNVINIDELKQSLKDRFYSKSSWTGAASTMNSMLYQYSNYSGNDYNITFSDIVEFIGKTVKIGSDYFKVNVNKSSVYINWVDIPASSSMTLDYWIPNLTLSYQGAVPSGYDYSVEGTPNNNTFRVFYTYYKYNVSLEQVTINATLSISGEAKRYHLADAPYDMFCIPYSNDLEMTYRDPSNGSSKTMIANQSLAVNMAVEISRKLGDAAIYDLQLLPYCPVRYCIQSDGSFDASALYIDNNTSHVDFIKDSSNKNIGMVFWATHSAFSFDINESITVSNNKLSNECDMYRLCSPNYNGQFEFSAAKNGGVNYFNVDCTYKPFDPYIHINPNFGNLYGQDFNDARGLICNGDFSLPQLSNAWANYQLNNKNYQDIFNRQIQNMEVNNAIQNTKSIVSAATGIIGGIVGGAVTGGVAGGIAGGIASAIGGAADVGLQIAGQQEAIDYTKDQFGYQLGNIQAIPSNITKTTAFTYNNKIFPIIEYYTCTDTEKIALENKLKYNGMTVMRIGTIREFLQNDISYIKGKFIRLLEVLEDFHYVNELANEFNKGVFIK